MTSAPTIRAVSLVPSATETLLAWGVDVVACTRFCEQPALVHVGGTKDPDVDAIVALAPDVVVVDREENRREDAEALAARGVTVYVMHVTSLADVGAELDRLAVAVGVAAPAIEIGPPEPRWATAFVPIWRRPWMSINADTYGSTLLAHVGVGNVLGTAPDRYPRVSLDEVVASAPDLVLLPTEPYRFRERHVGELAAALPGAHVTLIDGQDLFWWGARTPGAVVRLREDLRAARRPG